MQNNNRIKPLEPGREGSAGIFIKAMEEVMGFVPNSVRTMAHIPGLLSSFVLFSGNIMVGNKKNAKRLSPWQGMIMSIRNMKFTLQNLKRRDRLPKEIKDLVAYISSYASGCRYCQAHTAESAFHDGVDPKKIEEAWRFESSDMFTNGEKAALRFALAASSVPNEVTDKHFEEMKLHFSDKQILELGATVALFGFLNRWNDSFATQLEDNPLQFAQKHLTESGWSPGKHNNRVK